MDIKEYVTRFMDTLSNGKQWVANDRDLLILKLVEKVEELESKIESYKHWIGEPDA